MTTYTDAEIASLSLPVLEREPDFQALLDARIAQLRSEMADAGVEWDTYMLRQDPLHRVCRHAAMGDLLYIRTSNDDFRATLRDFATGADLAAKAADWGLTKTDDESVDEFRHRLEVRQKGQSGAGPDDWYANHVFDFAPDRVADVSVSGDGRGNVLIAILSKDNSGLASDDLIASISALLNQQNIRLTNDTLHVVPAVIKVVDVAADVWLLPDAPTTALVDAVDNLAKNFTAARKLGWALERSWISAQLFVTGVKKVELPETLVSVPAAFNQAVALGVVTPNFKGREA